MTKARREPPVDNPGRGGLEGRLHSGLIPGISMQAEVPSIFPGNGRESPMAHPILHFNQETFLDPSLPFSAFHHVQDDGLWHDHDFFEIAYVLKGRGHHLSLRDKRPIRTGDLIFINTGEPHAYGFTQPLELWNTIFSLSFFRGLGAVLPDDSFLKSTGLGAFQKGSEGGSVVFQTPAFLRPILETAFEEMAIARTQWTRWGSRIVELRFAEFLHRIAVGTSPSRLEETNPTGAQVRSVHRVIQYLHRHYARTVDFDAVARDHGFHPASWSTLFRQVSGSTPMAYLTEIRLQKARFFLKYSETPVAEVGQLAGFSQETLFHRLFKKHTGMSPRAYRIIRGEGLRKLPKGAALRTASPEKEDEAPSQG